MYRTPSLSSSSFLFSPFLLSHSPPFFYLSPPLSSPVSKLYNRVLVLDEVVQCTEEDEWAYHEMVAHIPLFSHPNPRSVSGVHVTTLELLHSSLFLSLASFSISCLTPPFFLSLSTSPYLPSFSPSSPPSLPISQGAGSRRGRWRCAERGCQTQDSGGDTQL